ncbi:MAG TPA: threonine--tRNA ligase [Kofleriaceae bacterium]|nr:threonine--tRNA ligase [Kofleriaceae bacterium]
MAEIVPKGYDPELYRMRHSAAHVMAQAVRERFGTEGAVHFAGGPPIEHGFYYDFALPRTVEPEDLAWIEARMKEIIASDHPFEVAEVSADEARRIFADQPFKIELIEGLASGHLDEDGNPREGAAGPARITTYQHDSFRDLCQGPHVERTGQLNPEALKLLSSAGAYWRGDERRPMLQRIYGTIWRTKEELDKYLWAREEAERRDHRRLGKELELIHFEPSAPGMPYWLPKGTRLFNTLLEFSRREHAARGYQEMMAPLLNEKTLWETSGHWEHYQENMFVVPVDEHRTFGLKPMNCPNAMVVFRLKKRSYRDLPYRLSHMDVLHRNERSGTMHGLLRVQKFQQDDSHIFVTEEQIPDEFGRVFELANLIYDAFGLSYTIRIGTRGEGFLGDAETWDRAESTLIAVADRYMAGKYRVEQGEGAFYGPKADILMQDALGREWQLGTIQLDFQLPRRFGCKYVDKDGSEKTPAVIHRALFGSLERFIGVLIEHTAGAFPVWLAPVQAVLIPVTDGQVEYCQEVARTLEARDLRVEVDDSSERMQNKIRQAQLQKVPYMLVVGKREAAAGTVAVRLRTGENLGEQPVDVFVSRALQVVQDRQGL